jgi:glycosyltransferase involved in cell wall biosynthesis
MAKAIRVLYSFPHKLGADRICYTAWQQVNTLAAAGAEVLAYPGVLHRPVHPGVRVRPTLSRGKLRISYKMLGTMRALAWHDHIVARRLKDLSGQIDIVHAWPDAALQTLEVARSMGIPTALERPNAHTRYAYEAVQKECEKLGIELPPDDEYAYKHKRHILEKEEQEYHRADYLLCPSDFVAKTFREQGFSPAQLARHQYGYDPENYFAAERPRDLSGGLTVLFAGICAVRKGLHFALEAWLNSPAHRDGTFLIAGKFLPAYAEKLGPMLAHPSVRVLGHRGDVPELMRKSDIFVLPSIEEGSALVTSDARGSGCVLMVSEAAGAICKHMENALIHPVGDTKLLTEHFALLHGDRALLSRLRAASLRTVNEITWKAAGERLLEVYREIVVAKSGRARVAS